MPWRRPSPEALTRLVLAGVVGAGDGFGVLTASSQEEPEAIAKQSLRVAVEGAEPGSSG